VVPRNQYKFVEMGTLPRQRLGFLFAVGPFYWILIGRALHLKVNYATILFIMSACDMCGFFNHCLKVRRYANPMQNRDSELPSTFSYLAPPLWLSVAFCSC
jgi:hypothetical protein